jgi:hypothetical protein
MAQSHTRLMGMAVHQDAIAVAYVAQEHGAEGMALGASARVHGPSIH